MKITAHCSSQSSQIPDSKTSQVLDSRPSQIPDFRASQVPDSRPSLIPDFRTSQVSIILKWIADSREGARFGYHFRTLLENRKTLETHQDPFMNVPLSRNWSSHPEGDSRT
jgi:hypothetical protein